MGEGRRFDRCIPLADTKDCLRTSKMGGKRTSSGFKRLTHRPRKADIVFHYFSSLVIDSLEPILTLFLSNIQVDFMREYTFGYVVQFFGS